MIKGTFVHDVRRIHEEYGDAVRLAPNEVSFAAPEAWHDVYQTFPKNPIWNKLPNGKQDPGLATTTNIANHARMRKLMDQAFTYRALKAQESIIQSYVASLMIRLREKAAAGGSNGGVIDAVNWFDFVTFDIVGDLGFGESFDCLKNSHYHPWVEMTCNYFQAMCLTAMTRYYPALEAISMKLLPQSLLDKQRDHFQLAVDKIRRRVNLETQRDDFVTPLIKNNKDMQLMTMEEIESTLNIIILAGSVTTSTALSGIISKLVQYPKVLELLVTEIRGNFSREEDITMTATKNLPYLNACISEGLRTCTPTPGGLARLAPAGGATVYGRWLPEDVSQSPSTKAPQRQRAESLTGHVKKDSCIRLPLDAPFQPYQLH